MGLAAQQAPMAKTPAALSSHTFLHMLATHAAVVRGVRLCPQGSRSAPCLRHAVRCRASASAIHPDIESVLLSREQIATRVEEVGR